MTAERARLGMIVGDRYELAEVLGQGGMGTVWRARDSVLRRDVAIKEVKLPSLLESREREIAVERSLREARAAAGINHPNVITVYDVVRQDERPWIVMEYMPCRSLEQLVDDDGPMAPERAAAIGRSLLKALRAAHQAGIQHRDVKPSNVLIRADDQVVLTDFGIASISGDPSLTRSGLLLGAPAYIAPERARGEPGGPSADLWSLGATLYATVEGRPPYDRGTALATLTAIVTEEVEPPVRAGALRPLLNGLLRRDPTRRINADQAATLLRRAARRELPTIAASARPPRRTTTRPPAVVDATPVNDVPSDDAGPAAASAAPPARRADLAPEPAGQENAPAARRAGLTPQPRTDKDTPAPAGRTVRAGRGRRRMLVTGAALVGLVIAAGILIGKYATRHDATAHGRSGGPAHSSAATPAPSPSRPASARASSGTATTVPAGYRQFTDPSGFSIAIPDGWHTSHDGHLLYVRDPHSTRYLMIDQTDTPRSNPVADWTRQEAERSGGWPGYRRVVIHSVPYFRKAADWEFTYEGDNGRVHVVNRGVVTSAHRAYGLYWSTPDREWSADLSFWHTFTGTLHPAP